MSKMYYQAHLHRNKHLPNVLLTILFFHILCYYQAIWTQFKSHFIQDLIFVIFFVLHCNECHMSSKRLKRVCDDFVIFVICSGVPIAPILYQLYLLDCQHQLSHERVIYNNNKLRIMSNDDFNKKINLLRDEIEVLEEVMECGVSIRSSPLVCSHCNCSSAGPTAPTPNDGINHSSGITAKVETSSLADHSAISLDLADDVSPCVDSLVVAMDDLNIYEADIEPSDISINSHLANGAPSTCDDTGLSSGDNNLSFVAVESSFVAVESNSVPMKPNYVDLETSFPGMVPNNVVSEPVSVALGPGAFNMDLSHVNMGLDFVGVEPCATVESSFVAVEPPFATCESLFVAVEPTPVACEPSFAPVVEFPFVAVESSFAPVVELPFVAAPQTTFYVENVNTNTEFTSNEVGVIPNNVEVKPGVVPVESFSVDTGLPTASFSITSPSVSEASSSFRTSCSRRKFAPPSHRQPIKQSKATNFVPVLPSLRSTVMPLGKALSNRSSVANTKEKVEIQSGIKDVTITNKSTNKKEAKLYKKPISLNTSNVTTSNKKEKSKTSATSIDIIQQVLSQVTPPKQPSLSTEEVMEQEEDEQDGCEITLSFWDQMEQEEEIELNNKKKLNNKRK